MSTGAHSPSHILAVLVLAVLPLGVRAQVTPEALSDFRNVLGDRIEALTILGGDYGLGGGTFRSTGRFAFGEDTNASLAVTKLGGAGELGSIKPLADTGIGWQLHLQGNIGSTSAQNTVDAGLLAGDVNHFSTKGVEIGGGVRLWLSDAFSITPTILVLYGHSSSSYTAKSAYATAHLSQAQAAGLIDWSANTLTGIGAATFEYDVRWHRTIFEFSVTPTYFNTNTVGSSNPNVNVRGGSTTVATVIDVDIPLGLELWGHELRSGGYIKNTQLYGGLRTGFNEDYLNELHGRLSFDFLNQLWKLQWLGLGGSYIWGQRITGWTFGADVAFRF